MTSKSIFRFALTFCLVSAFFSPLVSADDALKALGQLPVQNGGRIKPFDSFARETVLSVTGKRSIEKQSPTQTVWLWMSETTAWNIKPFFTGLLQGAGTRIGRSSPTRQNFTSKCAQ
jgi:hypothetical protein